MIDEHNNAESSSKIEDTCEVGDKVTCKKHGILHKLVAPRRGPFEVTHVYANGSVCIQPGNINEQGNNRYLAPFLDET